MLASVCWRDSNFQDVLFQTNRFSFHVTEEKEGFDQQFIHYYASKKKKICVSWQGFKNKTSFTFDNIRVWQSRKMFSCNTFGLLELHWTKIVYVSATAHPLGILNFLIIFFNVFCVYNRAYLI